MITKGSEVYEAEEIRRYLTPGLRAVMDDEDLYYGYYCVPGMMCPGWYLFDNYADCDLWDAVTDGYVERGDDGLYRLARA